jgi:hypothetical protein
VPPQRYSQNQNDQQRSHSHFGSVGVSVIVTGNLRGNNASKKKMTTGTNKIQNKV